MNWIDLTWWLVVCLLYKSLTLCGQEGKNVNKYKPAITFPSKHIRQNNSTVWTSIEDLSSLSLFLYLLNVTLSVCCCGQWWDFLITEVHFKHKDSITLRVKYTNKEQDQILLNSQVIYLFLFIYSWSFPESKPRWFRATHLHVWQ